VRSGSRTDRSRRLSSLGRKRLPRIPILVQVLLALVTVLVASSILTGVLETRLTTSALGAEARRITTSQLSILNAAYRERERSLGVSLKSFAELIIAQGLNEAPHRNELIAGLGRTATSLQLDLLQLIHQDGKVEVGIGRNLSDEEVADIGQRGQISASHLVRSLDGPYVQVVVVPVGLGGQFLVGGYDFSDAFAYRLRTQLGGSGEVILAAGGEVVGTTLSEPLIRLPGAARSGQDLPTAPTSVQVGEVKTLIAYLPVGTSNAVGSGALGVVLRDPVAALDRSLATSRLFSSAFLTLVAVGLGWFLFRSLVRPLVGLSNTAARIAGGDLEASFAAPRDDEVGRLARALQGMTRELRANAQRLQEVSKRILAAQEQERQRMARDLHDGLQTQLVALVVRLKEAARGGPERLPLDDLAGEAEEAVFALQELSRGIYPSVLSDQGLNAALRTCANRLPLEVKFEVDPELEERRFSPEVEGTLYFVALEAMANAEKHAPGGHLNLALSGADGQLVLAVSDNGPGFDPGTVTAGAGLRNMADRVTAVGGTLQIEGVPGAGTRISAQVPITPSEGPYPEVADSLK